MAKVYPIVLTMGYTLAFLSKYLINANNALPRQIFRLWTHKTQLFW